ncbi:MAG: type II CAAX endopeptidase family protein [Elainellaceae cyanobacterium]
MTRDISLDPIGWIGVFFAAWVLLWLPIAVPLAQRLHWRPFQPATAAQKLPLLAILYGLAPLVLWSIQHLSADDWADYGLGGYRLIPSAGAGLAMGLAGIAVLYGVRGVVLQRLHPDQPPLPWQQLSLPVLLGLLAVAASVGFIEELVFRGFLLHALRSHLDRWAAGAIASVIFASLHLVWDGRGTVPQLPGLWLMGMVLTLACWVDDNAIGLAWGLHTSWVWGVATVDTLQGDRPPVTTPAWLVGIHGQPLAGALGLLLLLGTGGGLTILTQMATGSP